MSLPLPQTGLVIRYSYLWRREAQLGRDEGQKDRPCAVTLVLVREGNRPLVRVLPITHMQPADREGALEVPLITKQRLGLDSEKAWIILDEANEFVWPGPDLRMSKPGDLSSVAYGMLPPGFMRILWSRLKQRRATLAVRRTD